jgi:hypothetical protein
MSKQPSEILDEMPPADPETERWVVGSAIVRPSVLDDLGFLQPGDFYDEPLSAVFAWLHGRHRRGEPIDTGFLSKRFAGDDWAARIAEIVHAVPTPAHAVHYGKIVAEKAKFRRLREIGVKLVQDAHRLVQFRQRPGRLIPRRVDHLGRPPGHRQDFLGLTSGPAQRGARPARCPFRKSVRSLGITQKTAYPPKNRRSSSFLRRLRAGHHWRRTSETDI